ncbi:hypothetical protein NW762_005691 [Fusarium torreyae]|uniref:Cell wall protein n=1 Tax=Fusarium torreyae TaxID=1237075 RepID=A0A9W8S3P2_9HYPO|nr:hypothetical protein NW762_005691 [Fusarium torreyae]
MRFAGSIIFGLLAVQGLAQTVVEDQAPEPSAVAAPEPSAPAAEEPSVPAADDDTPATQEQDAPAATADLQPSAAEPTADEPEETADATQASDADQPTATASDDDSDDATATAEETATADATATDDEATATGTATDEDSTNTATLTATSSSAPTSTSAVVDVDLKNATIGDNAELIKVDGKTAIKLSAPAGGQASFSVAVDTDDDFSTDELIYIVASILVGDESDSAKLRRRATKTDCTLEIQANSQSVYSEPLTTTNGKFQDVTSNGVQSSENPQVQLTQKCGDKPSPLTVNNVRLGNESGVKSSTGGGSGKGGSGSGSGSGSGRSGSGSGSGSESATTTGSGASETGDSNMGAKAKASVGGFVAAVLAAAALV